MLRLNVQVNDELFDLVEKYAKRYRITRSAAVSCLLTFALDTLLAELEILRQDRGRTNRGIG